MSPARYLIGDTRAVLRTLPDASVDLVLTSPPFLALRSYLPADHPDKALEMGSEPTPGEFIDALLDVVEECARVLAPHGSIAIELGDTYSGSGGGGGDYLPGGMREGQQQFSGSAATMRESNAAHWRIKNQRRTEWPEAKSLCLIPELFRVALVYGFNPLTGRETPRWRARNVVRWHRPNPPVGALGDKFRPATSDMVIACKSTDRYFDLDAVRSATSEPVQTVKVGKASASKGLSGGDSGNPDKERPSHNPRGAPPLDTWVIPTQPYEGSHYATWPEALCVRPIKAMCPLKVCTVCGQPSRRIVEHESFGVTSSVGSRSGGLGRLPKSEVGYRVPDVSVNTTVGWTDCGHDAWRPGVVLDPFAGSGTTLQVATGHGRDAIGIDLDERNADLATQRIGPLMCNVEAAAAREQETA